MRIYFFNKEVEKFIISLEKCTIAKALKTIDLLEKFGHKLSLPHSKKVDNRLFELRIHGVQEIRFFYTFHKNTVIILQGYIKKSQKLPKKEINKARQRLKGLA